VIKRFYLSEVLLLLFCLIGRTASAETPELAAQPSDSPTSLQLLFLPPFSHSQGIQKSAEPVRNTFLVNLGPKMVELKASYLERREESNNSNGLLDDGKSQRYFDLLATSSYLDSKMIAEGELGYSALDSLKTECRCDELPRMMRLGLKHRWGDFSYGADYRSLGKGFVSITGARVDQPRDEAQLWGERILGPFKLRGSLGESWERLSDINLKLTKIAAAALNFNRPEWGGWLASSYSLTDESSDLGQEIKAFTNTFASSYRPLSGLSLGQNFSIKEERDQSTGIRTETPTAALTVVYTPLRDLLKLSGGGSYTRTLSKDRSSDVRTVGATAAMDWKIGQSMRVEEFLSFDVTYNHQLDFVSSTNSHEDLSATLRYKITGF
jgi:hypothetical protein